MTSLSDIITTEEAALILGIAPGTVRAAASKGQLAARKANAHTGRPVWLVSRADAFRLWEGGRRKPGRKKMSEE
jgi:hypothetical protein